MPPTVRIDVHEDQETRDILTMETSIHHWREYVLSFIRDHSRVPKCCTGCRRENKRCQVSNIFIGCRNCLLTLKHCPLIDQMLVEHLVGHYHYDTKEATEYLKACRAACKESYRGSSTGILPEIMETISGVIGTFGLDEPGMENDPLTEDALRIRSLAFEAAANINAIERDSEAFYTILTEITATVKRVSENRLSPDEGMRELQDLLSTPITIPGENPWRFTSPVSDV